ncbi:MAG: peptidoglycan DD-metalloendopeptidase family protein [Burkholderiales bacterium]|nr:peptidoglycan DD-metalloendopeptidase family protein [Burkholderiales bacterium]
MTVAAHSFPRLGVWCGLICLLAAGCAAKRPAPVIERAPQAKPAAPAPSTVARPAPRQPDAHAEFYTVRQGDTLYSIALDHGLDYRELAAWNNVDPSRIRVGQRLRLTPPAGTVVASPLRTAPGTVEARPLGSAAPAPLADNVKTQPKGMRIPYSDKAYAQMASISPEPVPAAKTEPKTGPQQDSNKDEDDLDWAWPAAGRIIGAFNDSTSKGIAIAGKLGQPVLASAAGRVIFSGTGIRGFGKLIVIKHNKTFLSVYAHNSELLVKEGQTVAKGQKIAEMGNTDADQVKLHFEIRRFGKPVDPVKLLPDRPT